MQKSKKLIQPLLLSGSIICLILWWHDIVLVSVNFLADNLFNNQYGITIIFSTLLLKILLVPILLKDDINNKKKLLVQSEIDLIKESYEMKIKEMDDKERKSSTKEMNNEINKVYKRYNINRFSIKGCFFFAIQIIMLVGFYRAISKSPEIISQNFLWFQLGEKDSSYILPIILLLTMMTNFLIGNTMKKRGVIIYSFISIVFFLILSQSMTAVHLYLITSYIFGSFQTLYSSYTAKFAINKIKKSTNLPKLLNDL
ncbi:hypothetical protein B4102_4037 [Heyndrickxia sporothermodurans]|uniref:Membrane insertase YidC/Oxa/ALB C-terminal domain-containing protein n=1 Tax=Heyndrickxia sporothermodurans TaxID=46224 RepID=A0A150KK55_9BACI|nr:YidC/Oxa1 family membrane protein insertase [Heyndrickxia sporothermodurans]KYC88505.1 hypothetical protein B4102_4037 [Heyndrickxia sporothermodurans]